jgi:hypothetical protein
MLRSRRHEDVIIWPTLWPPNLAVGLVQLGAIGFQLDGSRLDRIKVVEQGGDDRRRAVVTVKDLLSLARRRRL